MRKAVEILAADEFSCLNYTQDFSLTVDRYLQTAVENFRRDKSVPDLNTMRHLALLSLVQKAVDGNLNYFEKNIQIVTK